MLVHTVFFWLRPDLSAEDRADFRRELEKLAAIPALSGFQVGVPAPTGTRPVIDASYDFAIHCLMSDVAAHDAYQVHPLHQAFVQQNKARWTRVLVYDFN